MTVKTLHTIRTDSNFDQFCEKVIIAAEKLEIPEPQLLRRRKVPKRYEDTSLDTHTFPSSPKQGIFLKLNDLITACIRNRFDQAGYRIYKHIEDLILKAANTEEYEEQFHELMQLYVTDFNASQLRTQLQVEQPLYVTN